MKANKSNRKKLLFKLWLFPRLTETFILSQIITAIKCGYNVKILVGELLEINEITHRRLIEQYQIQDKIIIEDHNIPNNKIKRYLKAFYLTITNPFLIREFRDYIKNQRKFELKHVYAYHYFRKFRNYDIVHVQYGTNAKPLDTL